MEKILNSFYTPLTPEDEAMEIVRKWSLKEKKGDKNARAWATHKIKDFLVETADGSYTLKSQKINDSRETMHTTHGALREAREKFAQPADLKGKKTVAILDICSGLGINAAAALEQIMDPLLKGEVKHLMMDLVEISWETLAASLIIPSPSESHYIIRKAIENYLLHQGLLSFPCEKNEIPPNVDIRVHCEDVRKMVMEISETQGYDAVFLDPFSPAKSPELYSKEFLTKVANFLKDEGVILTYTSAAPVRHALLDGGLEIGEGPALARSGGTIASPSRVKIPKTLSSADERMIALSDAGIPYRDPDLNLSANEINENRHLERISARNNSKIASTVKTPIYLASGYDRKNLDDERIKRRVLKHLESFSINDLNSLKSRFLVCPQFSNCICCCGQGRLPGSRSRIKEMEKRLKIVADGNFKMIIV
jgi:tRNA U34 5-methylaminomethyl-2-thiouridine-forming methyltransferase MnmC